MGDYLLTRVSGSMLLRRTIVRTIMALALASSASGQAKSVAPAEKAQLQGVQVQQPARPIPPEIAQRLQTLHSALQPSARAWVEQEAHIVAQQRSPDLSALEAAIRNRFSTLKPSREPVSKSAAGNVAMPVMNQGSDIEAVALIVLMEAANEVNADLQNMMQEVQRENQRKQALRQLMDETNQLKAQGANSKPAVPCVSPLCQSLLNQLKQLASQPLPQPLRLPSGNGLSYSDLSAIQQQAQKNLDSLNDLSEQQSLKLQMAMDRRSKFIDTLSNVMKKIGDTDSSIVANLK